MALDGFTRKQFTGTIKTVDRAKREIEFVATRQEVDADSEVIVTRGIDLTRYLRNPTLLLEHDRGERFGRVDSLVVQTVDGADALVCRATILPGGVSPAADQAYAELLHGALGAFSIGFMAKEIDPTPILPGQSGVTYKRIELLEISAVSIPACASAVVTAKSARAGSPDVDISPADIRHVTRECVREALGVIVARSVRRAVDRARGRVPDPDIDIESIPARRLTVLAPTKRGPEITLPNVSAAQLRSTIREAAKASVEQVLRRQIEAGLQRGINRLRGRVD